MRDRRERTQVLVSVRAGDFLQGRAQLLRQVPACRVRRGAQDLIQQAIIVLFELCTIVPEFCHLVGVLEEGMREGAFACAFAWERERGRERGGGRASLSGMYALKNARARASRARTCAPLEPLAPRGWGRSGSKDRKRARRTRGASA